MSDPLHTRQIQGLIQQRIENLRTIAEGLETQLATIESAAAGQPASREEVLFATDLILENLYRGLLSPRPLVPKDFWQSPLGLAIARAHTRVIHDEEVMSQAEAAQVLGVSREYISQLVEGGKVATVVREAAAPRSRKQPREMLYRSTVENLKAHVRAEARERRKAAVESDGSTPGDAGPEASMHSPPDEAGRHSGGHRAAAPRLS